MDIFMEAIVNKIIMETARQETRQKWMPCYGKKFVIGKFASYNPALNSIEKLSRIDLAEDRLLIANNSIFE